MPFQEVISKVGTSSGFHGKVCERICMSFRPTVGQIMSRLFASFSVLVDWVIGGLKLFDICFTFYPAMPCYIHDIQYFWEFLQRCPRHGLCQSTTKNWTLRLWWARARIVLIERLEKNMLSRKKKEALKSILERKMWVLMYALIGLKIGYSTKSID